MRTKMKLAVPQKAEAEITITATIGDFMECAKQLEILREKVELRWLAWPLGTILETMQDAIKAANKETHIYTEDLPSEG